MWFQSFLNYSACGVPLWVILLCGLVGVLVDIDHLISYYLIPRQRGRFLHTPLLIISCVALLGCSAYLGGLLIKMVLGL